MKYTKHTVRELLRDPRVQRMARFLAGQDAFRKTMIVRKEESVGPVYVRQEAVMRVVITGLLMVWAGAEGKEDFCNIDQLSGIPCFGQAMQDAGFITVDADGAVTFVTADKSPMTIKYPAGFVRFWDAYPRKVAKREALKAWDRLKPTDRDVEDILQAIDRQKRSQEWRKDHGEFIPHPSTWLNQGRWEDVTKDTLPHQETLRIKREHEAAKERSRETVRMTGEEVRAKIAAMKRGVFDGKSVSQEGKGGQGATHTDASRTGDREAEGCGLDAG